MACQMDKRETKSDHKMEKKKICKYSLFKECFKKIPWDVSVMKIKNKLFFIPYTYSVYGVDGGR